MAATVGEKEMPTVQGVVEQVEPVVIAKLAVDPSERETGWPDAFTVTVPEPVVPSGTFVKAREAGVITGDAGAAYAPPKLIGMLC